MQEQLLAAVFDVLQGANYQRGGGKGRRPKPLARPGVAEPAKKTLGGSSYSISELNRKLGKG